MVDHLADSGANLLDDRRALSVERRFHLHRFKHNGKKKMVMCLVALSGGEPLPRAPRNGTGGPSVHFMCARE